MTSFSNTSDKNKRIKSSQASNAHPMPTDGSKSFDPIIIAFHWVTVIAVFGLLATALLHAQSHDDLTKVLMLRVHRSLGVAVWLVTVCRVGWRVSAAQMPPFPATMTTTHRAVVQFSEYGLYALLVIQPTTGFTATITRGRSFDLFWWNIPPLIGHYPALHVGLFIAHRLGAWMLIMLIAGHAISALIHHFVLHDDVMQRMMPLGAMQRRENLRVETSDQQASFEVS
jgi:superoxide oxidase